MNNRLLQRTLDLFAPHFLYLITSDTLYSSYQPHFLPTEFSKQLQANVSKSSSSAPPAENGEPSLPTRNVVLSSCDHRYYVPTPYNSPVRRNPRQTSINGTPPSRPRGGGPSKRSGNTPNKATTKKIRVSINGRYNRKDLLYDDPEMVLADGNSPLYEHPDLTVSPNPTSHNMTLIPVIGSSPASTCHDYACRNSSR
jgi:hypothetical protein